MRRNAQQCVEGATREARAPLTRTLGHMARGKILRAAIWIGCGCIVMLAAAYALFVSRFADGMCGNEVLTEVLSPDSQKRAVVFQRDCGATTGFSTQASVLRIGKSLPNDGGNIFIADTNHGAVPYGPGGGPYVAVFWEGTDELVVRYRAGSRIFKAEQSLGDTHVRFVPE